MEGPCVFWWLGRKGPTRWSGWGGRCLRPPNEDDGLLTRRLPLTPQEVLLVRGPGRVILASGAVSAVGLQLRAGVPVVVRKNKIVPFEAASEEAAVTLSLADEGDYEFSREAVGMKPWREVGARLLAGSGRKVVVIGESDSGKSTLTTFLVNLALRMGRRVGVVDGDVGQGDLAPPCAVGASKVAAEIADLRDVRGHRLGFVGATSPRGFEGVVNEEVQRLETGLEKEGVDLIVVNTDGYVREGGADHKISLSKALRPDCVVCLGSEPPTARIASEVSSSLTPCNVLSVPSVREVVKSSLQRAERRITQYHRFLAKRKRGLRAWQDLDVHFRGVRYRFDSHAPSGVRFVAVGGKRLLIRRGGEPFVEWDAGGGVVFSSGALDGMFVGLGREQQVRGFGMLSVASLSNLVAIETPLLEPFCEVYLSTVMLLRDLREERVIPWFSHPNIG